MSSFKRKRTVRKRLQVEALEQRRLLTAESLIDGAAVFGNDTVSAGEVSDPAPAENQPPKIDIPAGTTVFEEGSEPVRVLPSVGISDPDSPNFGGGSLRVSFAEQSAREGDRLSARGTDRILIDGENVFDNNVQPPRRISELDVLENGRLLIFYFNEQVNHDLAESIARTVHFGNPVTEPIAGERFIRFQLSDGEGGKDVGVRRVELATANDAPVIEFSKGATLFTEGSEPVVVDRNVEVGDPDSPNFGGGKLIADFVEESRREGDRLGLRGSEQIVLEENNLFLVDGGQNIKIAEFGFIEGDLVIEFTEAANAAVVQKVARQITFGNESQTVSGDNRFVRFIVTDGDGGSAADIRRIEVDQLNRSPVVEFSAGTTFFAEDENPVFIDRNVEVGDADSPNFGGGKLIVDFVEQSRREGDRLGIRGSELLLIQGSDLRIVVEEQTIKIAEFGFIEGSLVIEYNQDADLAAVQKVARHITFGNELQSFSKDDRFVRFSVQDPEGGTGFDVRRIDVEAANDPPIVEFSEGPTEFNADAGPFDRIVRIDPQVEIADPDSTDFAGGQLKVFFVEESKRTGDFVGLTETQERTLLIGSGLIRIPGEGEPLLVGEHEFNEGVLIITFNQQADAAVVQTVARHVTFGNASDEAAAGDRFVKFLLTDGDGGQGSDVKRITVPNLNDDPVVEVAERVTIFEITEAAVIVSPAIEIGDSDSADFGGGILDVRMIEQTGTEADSFGIRNGEGIEVEGRGVFANIGGETKLIGEIREASDGIAIVIELTEHATPEITQRLARRITFTSTVSELGEAENSNLRFVRFSVNDGDGGSASDVKRIELIFQPDDDFDGVDDNVEDDAPFDGDGNQDGVPDSEQQNVASVRGDGDRFVTFASPEDTRLVEVQPMDNPSPDDQPTDVEFPVGFFDFNVEGVESSVSTMVTINLEPGTAANSFFVFGPTPDDPNPHWYPFLYDGETGAKIFGDRIEVHYIDGQLGDSDLSENGVIADPGAPALTQYPWQNPSSIGDVNFDGNVTALDALVILNDLQINKPRSLPAMPSGADQLAYLFLDVSGDHSASSLDALRVINLLAQNRLNASPAESEIVPRDVAFGLASINPTSSDDDDDGKRLWDEAIVGIAGSLS